MICNLILDDFDVKAEDIKILSPYLTAYIKRFGDSVVDLSNIPLLLVVEFTFSI